MEKIVNIRDLGGIVNQQGQRVCTGKLFRSANPSVANASDYQQLKKLNLAEIIDFRSEQEKRADERLFAEQFNWVAKPIFTGNIVDLVSDQFDREQAMQNMCMVYRRFPSEFQKEFRYLLKQAEQGKIFLYHCTAGKDRTGFATLLLLSALGVTEELIMEDYLLSNNAISSLKQQIADFVQSTPLVLEALDAVLGVYAEYLEAAIAVINKQYGGIQVYLTDTLAIDVKAIRQHYLED